jgi:ABC-type transport system involved in multi-copper enzyme maturation permease subunit
MSAGIIISVIVAIVLLFTSMVLSAMSSTAVNNNDKSNAHKYAMISAIVCGLSVLVLGVVLVIYISQAKKPVTAE